MAFSAEITKRVRRRKLVAGEIAQTRYVLSYKDPKTRKRRQEFFERQGDAQARRATLMAEVSAGRYVDKRDTPTVAEVVNHWLADREGQVKAATLDGYRQTVKHIVGPLVLTGPLERAEITAGRASLTGLRTLPMLGQVKVCDLGPADIRQWFKTLTQEVGAYTARRAKMHLRAALVLAEEDFGVRAPSMPSNLARAPGRPKRDILGPSEIGVVLAAAQDDLERGIYYAFPFLAGTRPSEQLGLFWTDLDFEGNRINICRVQERDGSITEATKTEAGRRSIPMAPILKTMLLSWRLRCPRKSGKLERVFPGLGRRQAWPLPRIEGGGPLHYHNFLKRIWRPAFKRIAVRYVTPHTARHSFISILQAQGVEVGLVAKLAGHASAIVTLGHYTQAVRGGQEAVERLEQAYQQPQLAQR